MHVQSRNPSRERDHRISLMPMERPDGEPGIVAGTIILLAVLAVIVVGFSLWSAW